MFEGDDHTISNLYINSSVRYIGLFGYLGSGAEVRNLGIEGGSVTTSASDGLAGGLVGWNYGGTIRGCYATGTATGDRAGGLVGINNNSGTISACYATGDATATGQYGNAGGLVGWNFGGTIISGCYATGTATGFYAGGLVGLNNGTIRGCYATGTATGGNAGGLVGLGLNNGTIRGCYATGTAIGGNAGGLVGENGGTIRGCYATGTATGSYAGGLVGENGGTISGCYATGNAEATGRNSRAGGLVGWNYGSDTITNSYFDSDLSGTTQGVGGGTIITGLNKTTAELQSPTAYGTGTALYAAWNIDIDDVLDPGLEDGTAPGDATADDPWDFGTDSQYPALRIDFDGDGNPSAYEFGEQGRAAPAATAPAAPVSLTAAPNATNPTTTIDLSWSAPPNGGSPITGYVLEYSTDGSAFMSLTDYDGNSLSYSHGGLSPGTMYYYKVEAINSVGTGAYSSIETATEDEMLSLSTANLSFDPGGGTEPFTIESNVSWTAMSNATWLTLSGRSGTSTTDIMAIAAENPDAAQREATITVVAGTGADVQERVVSVTQAGAAAIVPGIPTGLTAIAVSDTQIDLEWQAPANTGGADITGCRLEYSTDGGNTFVELHTTPDGTTFTYEHTGLAVGTTYHYQVAAINSAGMGAYSSVVSATINDILSVPGVEGSVRVYPNPASQEVRLTNLPAAAHYRVYSLAGKVALTGAARGSAAIDVSGLARGQYILVLKDEEDSEVLRTRLLLLK